MDDFTKVVFEVQKETDYHFDIMDLYSIARHTARKAELNQKDEVYALLLFRNELEDFVMREQINGRYAQCINQ